MRIQAKGGIWKNTEDEILKAAVMKYGKNQWARISSLLVRKSAKQCKARWYEWLDPSIKKTEWGREEEEKLLHLAKIMPNQWRTIAPMVGRTASQCLEHYEKLLDAAQSKDKETEPHDDPRRLRPGEIDPNPEAKPARPDPIDMDEDEKEMLSEARARLANTKGKKAKRKAREKQLEEARRLAALQKRRELKAAGIDIPKPKRRIKGIDYNKEIPFQKKPPPGFYEVDFDAEKEERKNQPFKSIDLTALKRKRDEPEDPKKKKTKKDENKKPMDALLQLNQLANEEAAKPRAKLMLSAPQLSDEQLEELAKLGTPEVAADADEEGQSFTKALLPNFGATPARAPLRTPLPSRTPAREDNIMKEAQNLVALTASQTPLIGGDNPELHPSDFTGITPKSSEPKTPNVLATPSRTKDSFMTPGRTPLRDYLSKEEEAKDKYQLSQLKLDLKSKLKSLPAPQNEYKIVLPEVPKGEEEEEENIEEDASESMERRRKAEIEAEQRRLRLRSEVLKQHLPRPPYISSVFADFKSKSEDEYMKQAEDMLRQEIINFVSYEAVQYPFKNSRFKGTALVDYDYDKFEDSDLEKAKKLVASEVEKVKENYGVKYSPEDFGKAWMDCYEDEVYLPSAKKLARVSALQKKERIELMSSEFDNIKASIEKESAKCEKIEKKITVIHGGYQKRSSTLIESIKGLNTQLEQARIELECFKQLQSLEEAAIPKRIESWKKLLAEQQELENENQRRYLNLITERDALLSSANTQ